MKLEKIDVISAEPTETAFDGIDQMEPGRTNIVWARIRVGRLLW